MDEAGPVFISIGSNLGDRRAHCQSAVQQLQRIVTLRRVSSLYETEPVEGPPQEWFYNAVVEVATPFTPRQMLMHCQQIEHARGRTRVVLKGPRTLDLDLLFWGHDMIQETDLWVPHPSAHCRGFVLIPLLEIAPDFVHPTLKARPQTLLDRLPNGFVGRKVGPLEF